MIEVRKLFGAQTGVGGNTIDLPYVFGLFGNDTIDSAEALLSPNYVPTAATSALTQRTRFIPLLERRLAATKWYGATDAFMSGMQYGYVGGNAGPQLEDIDDPMHDAIAYKVRLEFAIWLSDWRGLVKNLGV